MARPCDVAIVAWVAIVGLPSSTPSTSLSVTGALVVTVPETVEAVLTNWRQRSKPPDPRPLTP
jgi:hypothetical protein